MEIDNDVRKNYYGQLWLCLRHAAFIHKVQHEKWKTNVSARAWSLNANINSMLNNNNNNNHISGAQCSSQHLAVTRADRSALSVCYMLHIWKYVGNEKDAIRSALSMELHLDNVDFRKWILVDLKDCAELIPALEVILQDDHTWSCCILTTHTELAMSSQNTIENVSQIRRKRRCYTYRCDRQTNWPARIFHAIVRTLLALSCMWQQHCFIF